MTTLSNHCTNCGTIHNQQTTICANCGQSLQIPAQKAIIRTLSGHLVPHSLLRHRYRILEQTGEGGMATVYKAADTQLGDRLVAVKEMDSRKLNQQELIEATAAFKREAHILACLHHVHLPAIYEYFFEEGHWYIVMNFIEGTTLEHYLYMTEKKTLPIKEVLDIGIQLCSVLEYLHAQEPPIIFRDLKPANVIRTPQGHLYLIDFGIARHFKLGQAKDTVALGSLGYAAPEQYGKAQTSPRSDIYSLGVTLHELLTGDDPSETPFEFAPLNKSALSVSAEFETLFKQMLEMNAANRPANVSIVKQKLQQIVALEPVQQIQVISSKAAKFPPPLRPPAPIGTTVFRFPGHSDQVTAISWSPDSNRIASASRDKTVQVWTVTSNKSNILIYRGHTAGVTSLGWSPDGKRIASGCSDRIIHVWDSHTGRNLLTYRGHNSLWSGGDAIKGLAWSSDGTRIASVSGDHTVHIWDTTTGKTLLTYLGHGDRYPVIYVAWSPDGIYIASVAKDCNIWNASTGRTLQTNRSCSPNAIAWSPDSMLIASNNREKLTKQATTVQVWEAVTGRTWLTYGGHSHAVTCLAWSHDGRYIASAEKKVHIWKASTGDHIYTYPGHTDFVSSLAWSLDGTRIVSASVDTTVQVWQAAIKSLP